MNATPRRIIPCPLEGEEMTGYNPFRKIVPGQKRFQR
jgi:hypothetical protein